MTVGRIPSVEGGIQPTIFDAKADLLTATANDTPARLAVGTNNQVVMADSAQAIGLKYANEATATLTTTGDTLYASGANTLARLGIGTTGQVLSVSGGVPAWATVSSGAMTQIADTTLTTSTADITFSSIPSTYNHLKIVISGTAASASFNGAAFYVQVNGDTAGNYSFSTNTKYAGPGATVTLEGQNSQSQIELGNIWCGQAAANSLGSIEMTFFNYKATTLHKGMVFTGGSWTDAPGFGSGWGRWKNTAAITSIKLYSNAGNHAAGTRATLYGWT